MTPNEKIAKVLETIKNESAINPDTRWMKFEFNYSFAGPRTLREGEQRRILFKLEKSGAIKLHLSKINGKRERRLISVISSKDARALLHTQEYLWVEKTKLFDAEYKSHKKYLQKGGGIEKDLREKNKRKPLHKSKLSWTKIGVIIMLVTLAWIVFQDISEEQRSEKAALEDISASLLSELKFNKVQIQLLNGAIDSEMLLRLPVFETSDFEKAIKTSGLRALSSKQNTAINSLYDVFENINESYADVWSYTNGLMSSVEGAENTRKFLLKGILSKIKSLERLSDGLDDLISELESLETYPELDVTSYQ